MSAAMSEKQEMLADISEEIRQLSDSVPGGIIAVNGRIIADRIEAAAKRESNSIERLIRDAIIDYQEMYAHAPNDDAECELVERAERGNAWLVSHGYEPEKTIWNKEEAPCL